MILSLRNAPAASTPTIVNVEFTIDEVVPVSEDIFYGVPSGNFGGSVLSPQPPAMTMPLPPGGISGLTVNSGAGSDANLIA